MSISLSPKTESLVEQLVSTGQYGDASEVVERAVVLFEERERFERIRQSILDASAAVDRGEYYEMNDEFWTSLQAEADEADRLGLPIDPDVIP